ncbi:MAG: nickel-dependent hydrogenase large subunit [Rhodanobacter sp.]|nr:nickel-dependent hydrogenase large subunit [Rhodanobacter sp.]
MSVAEATIEFRLDPRAPADATLLGRAPLPLATWLRGRPADEAPERLAGLYVLCGEAHRQAARLAIAAARGCDGANDGALAHLDVANAWERMRLIAQDWRVARGLPVLPLDFTAWRAWRAAPDDAALRARCADDLHRHVYTAAPTDWLARYHAGAAETSCGWWSDNLPQRLWRMPLGLTRSLRATDLPAAAARLAADATQASLPDLADGPVENGPWSAFADDEPSLATRAAAQLARLAETVTGAAPPPHAAAQRFADGSAAAWVDSARGWLLHWLRLHGDAITDYRVLAPTEWNFHPRGGAVQAFRALASEVTASVALAAVTIAYAPCVACRYREVDADA